MSENNSFGKIRWYACIAFLLAFCLTLSPLAYVLISQQDELFGKPTEPSVPATTPEETSATTPPAVTTPEEETTPALPSVTDSFITYTVTVVDEKGAPLAGAKVQLFDGNNGLIPVFTDADGVASVLAKKANYTIKTTFGAYEPKEEYQFKENTTACTVEMATKWKLTTVTVTTGEDMSEIYAGAEMLAYLQKKGISYAKDGFPISIEIDPSLGLDSFKIEVSLRGDVGMTIRGGNGRGVIYAVYRFLEKYAGFRYLAPGLETQTEDDVIITEGTLMDYSPQILGRRLSWTSVSGQLDWMLKNGINNPTISPELGGDYLNYGDYFVHTIGKLSETTYPYPDYCSNPCLTDPEIYETVLKNVRAALEKNPKITIISISQTDVEDWCHCPNCSKIEEEEGSYAGVWIRFVNKIAEELEDEYPDVLIDTLAYKHTQTPPKITKPHKNVCVRLCSIKCCFTHPLSDPNCEAGKKFYDDIVGWGAICDNVHIWDYTTNFHYYISTFANFGVLQKNMQFFAENNVTCMFPQGNGQGASGEFGELRAYLLAQLMWNPYMTEEEYYGYMDDFLKGYYGAGWENIRDFIDKTTELAANGGYSINEEDETLGDAVCGQGIYDHPFTAITRQEYLNYEYLFDEYWALAEELAGDRVEYVRRSMLQWRLTKLYLYPDAEKAQKLIDDAKALGVVWKEGKPNVLPESDLSLSPFFWEYGS